MNEEALTKAPFAASEFAAQLDPLFYTLLVACGAMTLAIAALIVIFCIRYRRGRDHNDRDLTDRNQAGLPRWLEYLWIAVPTVIFLGFFAWGAQLFIAYQTPPEDPLVIHAIAQQWMWKFYHPGGQGEINQLHIPVNRHIQVILASEDVIHSFFVPNFRVKQDVVPGRYTRANFRATSPGVYRLFCAEFCGTDHSQMRGMVEVMTPENYAAWLEQQPADDSLVTRGDAIFRAKGCSGCHAAASPVHAPELAGAYQRVVHLRDGATVIADLPYLRDAILLPDSQVVAGYEPIMPSFAGQLSEEEMLALLVYLQSLRSPAAPPTHSLEPMDAGGKP